MIFSNVESLKTAAKIHAYSKTTMDPFIRINQIDNYLKTWGITDVVVGMSGGIDSAVVIAMLSRIPGINVHMVHVSTGSDFACGEARRAAEALFHSLINSPTGANLSWQYVNIEDISKDLFDRVEHHTVCKDDAAHNSAYALRYTTLFSYAQGIGGITVGTTNASELLPIGWFGKTSDMMVDLQVIWDQPKRSVYAWADILGVPEKIIRRAPTGDIPSGKTDEEVFGVSYEELEYFFDVIYGKIPLTDFLKDRFASVLDLVDKNRHKFQKRITHYNPIFIGAEK